MTQPSLPPYRREKGQCLIEIQLNSIHQLFNTLDPAAFHDRDLDDDAEQYIVSAMEELRIKEPVKIILHVPERDLRESLTAEQAIHNYFAYRLWSRRHDLRQTIRNGLWSLLIGLVFLVSCWLIRRIFFLPEDTGWVAEGLDIVGWVAMWRPLEILLYDWWPILRSCRIMKKLTNIAVEVRATQVHPFTMGGASG